MSHRPGTLFLRTGLTLGTALLLFSVLAVSIFYLFFIQPVSRQAAEDLAGLLVLTAQTWAELPPATRPDYERELRLHHHLRLATDGPPLTPVTGAPPYFRALESALSERLGAPLAIGEDSATPGWYWADITMGGHQLRLGFRSDRLGERLPLAVLIITAGGALILLASALLFVRRITRPLERMEAATGQVGRNRRPTPLPESGPRELASLARAFNRMEQELHTLLESRTTLMAGISHDLRTPLARMRLALEFLREDAEPEILAGMERDLEEMEQLLGQTLALARGVQSEPPTPLALEEVLHTLAGEYRGRGQQIDLRLPDACPVSAPPGALRRVLTNLLDNAFRYGGGAPVTLRCAAGEAITITIADRGPGIPPEQRDVVFEPFHRLEHSRSRATGGSGLGLAIVRQLCDANGWRISLHDHDGGGLEARLTLPREEPTH